MVPDVVFYVNFIGRYQIAKKNTMKNKVINGAMLVCAAWVVLACNPRTPAPVAVDKEQIKKEIQAREDEFAAVYNSGQLKNIGYYPEDAITFPQNHDPLIGKAAIVEYLVANMDSLAATHKISFKTNEVFVCDGGKQVLEIGYYKVVDANNNPVNTGNYMSLFEKRDGKYVCLRDMSTTDMPLE
jgi:ketosteroid isomerase-like protein